MFRLRWCLLYSFKILTLWIIQIAFFSNVVGVFQNFDQMHDPRKILKIYLSEGNFYIVMAFCVHKC